MPKGEKKAKPKSKEPTKDKEERAPVEEPRALEKEFLLKEELRQINEDVANLRLQVSELNDENEWLQQEKERTQLETQEYMGYMSKRAQKRQSLIVSLTDENQRQLEEIQRQKEELIKYYEHRKSDLKSVLIERETELAKLKSELRDLEQFKSLQVQQDLEIERLEKHLEQMKFEHENTLCSMRSRFLRQRQAFEDEYEARKKAMSDSANLEAGVVLKKQSERIKLDNRQLRQELHQLIQTTQELQKQKASLQRQYQALVREKQLQDSLDKLKLKRTGWAR